MEVKELWGCAWDWDCEREEDTDAPSLAACVESSSLEGRFAWSTVKDELLIRVERLGYTGCASSALFDPVNTDLPAS